MYFVISVVSIFLLGLGASFILPWWSICIVSFLIGIILHNKCKIPFVSGAMGSMLLWLALMLYYGNKDNFSFTTKVSSIFSDSLHVPISAIMLIIVTLALIGLLGGLSSWSGKLLFSSNQPNKISVGKRRVKNEGYTLKL